MRQQSVRNTASDFYGELFSCSPIQLHPIKHPRLFNHLSQYPIIQVIRRHILGIQAHALILPRLRFSQLEDDAVDGGCGLFFEVYFVGGHLDEYLGFRYGTYDETCPLRCIIILSVLIYYVPVLFVHTVQPMDQGQNHLCTK